MELASSLPCNFFKGVCCSPFCREHVFKLQFSFIANSFFSSHRASSLKWRFQTKGSSSWYTENPEMIREFPFICLKLVCTIPGSAAGNPTIFKSNPLVLEQRSVFQSVRRGLTGLSQTFGEWGLCSPEVRQRAGVC